MTVLETSPTDAEANLAAGRYLCLVKWDWDRAVAMLALGSDPGLKAVAKKELQRANSAEEQVAVGDAWWSLADTGRFPVETISWDEVMAFCRCLSDRAEEKAAGRVYRLPTEPRAV